MNTSLCTLRDLVDWTKVLPQLGVPVRTTALPAVLKCPFCQATQLGVYKDRTGVWLHCRNCTTNGDIIELACNWWKVDLAAAIDRLIQLKAVIATPTEGQVRNYTAWRGLIARANRFWREAQANFTVACTPELRTLQRQFRCADATAGDWARRGGLFIGASHRDTVEATFAPGDVAARKRRRTSGRLAWESARIFTPRNTWSDVLVSPQWDMPGRIYGFMFIGREGGANDVTYVWACGHTNYGDAGIGFAPVLQQLPHARLGSTVFALTDPLLGVSWQMQHMHDGSMPLPIILPYHSERSATKLPWNWVAAERIVFWGPQTAPADLVKQAIPANGLIAVYEATAHDRGRNFATHRPLDWLERLQLDAVHWQVYLRQLLRKTPDNQVEGLVAHTELSSEQLRNFVDDSDAALKLRLERILAGTLAKPSIHFSKVDVVEENGTWVDRKGRRLICGCLIRIDEIFVGDKMRNFYKGRILFGGCEYPFSVPAIKMKRAGVLHWVDMFLRKQGTGRLVYDPLWNRKILTVIQAMSRPTVRAHASVVGWHPGENCFHLPNYAIRVGGETNVNLPLVFTGRRVPARHLARPSPLSRLALDLLSEDNRETQLVWALASGTLASILAPAFNQAPPGVILTGYGARQLGPAIAEHFGCLTAMAPNWKPVTREVTQAILRHRWPSVLHPGPGRVFFLYDWLTKPAARWGIALLPLLNAYVLGIRNDWTIVECRDKLGTLQLTRDVVDQIVPAYLHDICERRLPLSGIDLASEVLCDLAEWFAREEGNAEAVLGARAMLQTPGQPGVGHYFTELICHMLLQNRLCQCREDHAAGQIVRVSTGPVWIPQQAFASAVEAECCWTPDVLLITRGLHEMPGVLLDEAAIGKTVGWVVDGAWWLQQMRSRDAVDWWHTRHLAERNTL